MRQPASLVARRTAGYSGIQITLHWTIAVLILGQFLSGDAMSGFFERMVETREAELAENVAMGVGATLHAVMGALILILTVARTALRFVQGVPNPTPESPGWDRVLSVWNHRALYLMLWLTPLLGASAYLLASEAAGEAHETAKTILLLLVLLHIAGAAYHQFILKDNLIARMMRAVRKAV